MKEVFNMLQTANHLIIVKITTHLFTPPFNTIAVNIVYLDSIVGEINIQMG